MGYPGGGVVGTRVVGYPGMVYPGGGYPGMLLPVFALVFACFLPRRRRPSVAPAKPGLGLLAGVDMAPLAVIRGSVMKPAGSLKIVGFVKKWSKSDTFRVFR